MLPPTGPPGIGIARSAPRESEAAVEATGFSPRNARSQHFAGFSRGSSRRPILSTAAVLISGHDLPSSAKDSGLHPGTTSRHSQGVLVLYQGTTSVVPYSRQKKMGASAPARSVPRESEAAVEATGFSPWDSSSGEFRASAPARRQAQCRLAPRFSVGMERQQGIRVPEGRRNAVFVSGHDFSRAVERKLNSGL
jgi:hypothetical protein